MIDKTLATDIALCYREIEAAQELKRKVEETIKTGDDTDLRDAFGRPSGGLQLGVPSGPSAHTLYNVPWSMCAVVLDAHIGEQRLKLKHLEEAAREALGEDMKALGEIVVSGALQLEPTPLQHMTEAPADQRAILAKFSDRCPDKEPPEQFEMYRGRWAVVKRVTNGEPVWVIDSSMGSRGMGTQWFFGWLPIPTNVTVPIKFGGEADG